MRIDNPFNTPFLWSRNIQALRHQEPTAEYNPDHSNIAETWSEGSRRCVLGQLQATGAGLTPAVLPFTIQLGGIPSTPRGELPGLFLRFSTPTTEALAEYVFRISYMAAQSRRPIQYADVNVTPGTHEPVEVFHILQDIQSARTFHSAGAVSAIDTILVTLLQMPNNSTAFVDGLTATHDRYPAVQAVARLFEGISSGLLAITPAVEKAVESLQRSVLPSRTPTPILSARG